MRLIPTALLSTALFLGQALPVAMLTTQAVAATPAETAEQVRANWAKARETYLASVQKYNTTSANKTLITQYTAALDKTGASLENYLKLKLASPATPADKMTPAVDQLYKDLLMLKAIRSKATGGLATTLGTALTQQNQATQTALANMR
jgi:hypothetical protein